jgi:hypothetical protein
MLVDYWNILLGLLLAGTTKTFRNSCIGCVGVKDVAMAHILAYESATATGHYICAEQLLHYADLVALLSKLYPTYPICAKWVIVTSPQFLFPFLTLTNKFSFWANFNMNAKHIWGHFDPQLSFAEVKFYIFGRVNGWVSRDADETEARFQYLLYQLRNWWILGSTSNPLKRSFMKQSLALRSWGGWHDCVSSQVLYPKSRHLFCKTAHSECRRAVFIVFFRSHASNEHLWWFLFVLV